MTDGKSEKKLETVTFSPIGRIRTPYNEWAPNQPVEQKEGIGKFKVEVDEKFTEGLKDLACFKYVILVFHLDRIKGAPSMEVTPPWAKGKKTGLFASRSPNRPNPLGISIVRLDRIEGNVLYTWPVDILDDTPLLDIKPYIATLDSKKDANDGWIDDLEGKEHLMEHVRGVPHDHHHHHHDDDDDGKGHSH